MHGIYSRKGVFPSTWYRVYCDGICGDNGGHFTSRTCRASATDCTPSWASGNNLVLPTTWTLHLMSLQTSVGIFSEEWIKILLWHFMYGPIKDIFKQYKALYLKTFCQSHLSIVFSCHCRPTREGS